MRLDTRLNKVDSAKTTISRVLEEGIGSRQGESVHALSLICFAWGYSGRHSHAGPECMNQRIAGSGDGDLSQVACVEERVHSIYGVRGINRGRSDGAGLQGCDKRTGENFAR